MRFDDQVAIVTGGAGGLGSTYARLLASRGAKVLVNDIGVTIEGEPMDPPPGDAVVEEIIAAGGEAVSDTHDVIDQAPEIVAAALEAFGRIDIVITSHLVHRAGPFGELALEDFEFGNENDYHGTVRVMHAAWPELVKTSGRALLTGSGAIFGSENLSSYMTSKGGIVALGRALGMDGRRHGIKVNSVLPFAGTRQGLSMAGFEDFMVKHATPQQVANGVLWLVHDSVEVTGQAFSSTGGFVSRVSLAQSWGWASPEGTPEDFRDHAAEIADFGRGMVFPVDAGEHVNFNSDRAAGFHVDAEYLH
ncbi:MAG: SDR family oxidoreductase [Actinobacteria bacterium]|nr:SDR family oxidoreductase [Actinomycetota bacterium]